MKEEDIREGDIVEIDYIAEFTKEHINEGKALVLWKGNNNQPLVRKLDAKKTIWTCYEHIGRIIDHIDIENYMDNTLRSTDINKENLNEVIARLEPQKMTNKEWINLLSEQFDVSRTSAKDMLHAMMSVKKEDNFKKQFNKLAKTEEMDDKEDIDIEEER